MASLAERLTQVDAELEAISQEIADIRRRLSGSAAAVSPISPPAPKQHLNDRPIRKPLRSSAMHLNDDEGLE